MTHKNGSSYEVKSSEKYSEKYTKLIPKHTSCHEILYILSYPSALANNKDDDIVYLPNDLLQIKYNSKHHIRTLYKSDFDITTMNLQE